MPCPTAMRIDSLLQDVRFALRSLGRSPGFVTVALLSLAAGIGLNTAVFTVVNSVFLQTIRGVHEQDAIAFVGGRVSWAGFDRLRVESRSFDGMTAWQPMLLDVTAEGVGERRTVPLVASDWFAVLGVPAIAGRTFAPVAGSRPEPEAVAVLDHQFWQQQYGGRADAIGRTLLVNRVPVTIVGVAPREFHGPGPERPPFWIPAGLLPQLTSRPADWGDSLPHAWRVIGRLRAGASLGGATAELRTLAGRTPALFAPAPMQLAIGREPWDGPETPEKRLEFLLVVTVPLLVVGVMLWIGCSNVANLLLARAVARRKEIVIRLATGAPRWRVVRMLLVESLLLALGGGALGLVVGRWTLVSAWATLPEVGNIAVDLDGRVLAYTLAVSVFSVLLFGLVPALQATRVDVAPALQGGGIGTGGRLRASRLRAFFLVTQIASSVVLLVVSATFVHVLVMQRFGERAAAMERMASAWVPSGAATPAARAEFWARVRERVGAIPGVQHVVLQGDAGPRVRMLPVGRAASDTTRGAAPAEVELAAADSLDQRVARSNVLAGRAFQPTDRAPGATGIVVNLDLARRTWGGAREAVGRRVTMDSGRTATVVGVVQDNARHARAYRLLDDAELADANLLVVGTVPAAVFVPSLRQTLRAIAPEPAFVRVQAVSQGTQDPLWRLTRVAVSVGLVALLLAAIGLYGSVSFHVGQRTREIAIRVAVGAAQQQLLRLVLGHGARLVAIGCAIGGVLAWASLQVLSVMVFGVAAFDLVALVAVALVFAATTLLASWVPGRRAMRVDPISVLRSE